MDAARRLLERSQLVAHGPDKVATLERAIADHVRPGMHLHVASTLTRATAAVYELLRAFRGRRPGFTFSMMSVAGPHVLPVTEGLVEHLICTFHGDSLPTPGPNPALQDAFARGAFTLSSLSILSFTQALWAAALGLPWFPTNSLRGSSMAEGRHVLTVDGELAVRALRPDLTFLHAPAADRYGNTVLGAPFGDYALGAWASRDGAIVTVERIVEPEAIAAHPLGMRIPGGVVRAVVEAPLGAHPGPLYAGGAEDLVPPIAEDTTFMAGFRAACRDRASLDAWLDEHVYAGPYAGRVDASSLRARAGADPTPVSPREGPATDGERAVVLGARALVGRVREHGANTMLAGVGMSNLAAWLARARLASDGVPLALMVELGLFDYVPPLGDPLLVSNRIAARSRGLGGAMEILGLGLASTVSIGALGAGQVDRAGNLNSSRTSEGGLLVGSGGSNDVASICRDVVVVCRQSAARFVEQVPYVTAPGGRVTSVATQLGLFERDGGELVLTGAFGGRVEDAKRACGWDLRVAADVRMLDEPTTDELALLRAFDPCGEYTA